MQRVEGVPLFGVQHSALRRLATAVHGWSAGSKQRLPGTEKGNQQQPGGQGGTEVPGGGACLRLPRG